MTGSQWLSKALGETFAPSAARLQEQAAVEAGSAAKSKLLGLWIPTFHSLCWTKNKHLTK